MYFEKIQKIIAEYNAMEEEEIGLDSHLRRDLELDELDMADIVMQIEDEFDIWITEEDWETFETVHDLVKFVEG